MTSKIKVDNINKVSDDSNIIKKCGTTTTIGSGASNPIVVDGSAVTLGRCGGTVALASGATQTGFGRTGTVDWQTTPKTATFTAVSGEGYFANTSGSAFNMNLPAGVAGAIVSVADYAESFDSNSLTIVPNGTDKIGSLNENAILQTKGQSVTLVYVDGTQGWINTMDSTSNVRGAPPFMCASVSGACNTLVTAPCCANVKVATFTGPGTFTVNSAAGCATHNVVSYLIIGGGGGSGSERGGGGGAGGFREVVSPSSPYSGSPLNGYPNAPNRITVSAQGYPITVGGGGAFTPYPPYGQGLQGGVSTFDTITSAGGGGGGGARLNPANIPVYNGGSGGGGAHNDLDPPGRFGGSGNTPPVSPAQGNNGGNTGPPAPQGGAAGGGGGSGGGGQPGTTDGSPGIGGKGGVGATSSINGSPTIRGGGGAGGAWSGPIEPNNPGGGPAGGGAGGGPGGTGADGGTDGTANTGGGAGGGGPGAQGHTGGSGIVIIRYKFQ